MSCARAFSSPLPQAFRRFVISAVRTSMDHPFPCAPHAGTTKNIQENVAGFGNPLPPVPAKEKTKSLHDLLQKAGSTYETHSNYGADGHYWCRRRLRTTDSGKYDVFGGCRSERDRSKASQHHNRGRKSRRERRAWPVHVSTSQS